MATNRYEITPLLIKYLKDKLTPSEQQIFDAWIQQNEANKALLREFEQAKTIRKDLEFLSSIDVEKDWESVCKRINESEPKVRKLHFPIWGAVAGILLAVFTLFYFIKNQHREVEDISPKMTYKNDVLPAAQGAQLILSDGSTVQIDSTTQVINRQGISLQTKNNELHYTVEDEKAHEIAFNTLVVPKGAYFSIVLVDGTKVWVNAMSRLKFPNVFSGNERKVVLEGEAYFEVAHNPNKPFIVECEGIAVEVLGTSFNVNSHNRGVRTTLVEGRVRLQAGAETATLVPGQRGDYSGGNIYTVKADLAREIAWKNGEFYFKRDNIVQILNEISRWYDLDVKLQGTVPLDKSYSGKISRQVKLSEVLDMLGYLGGLSFEIEGHQLLVREKSNNK